jgi:hypothetical protein
MPLCHEVDDRPAGHTWKTITDPRSWIAAADGALRAQRPASI